MLNFNEPYIAKNQMKYIEDAINKHHTSGDGEYTKRCHKFFEKYFGVPKALLTTSCTHAMEMSAMLIGLKEGDEVIVPSFTFVSTPNAFMMRGAKPIFIDIKPDTLNIDETKIEEKITKHTKAFYLVHYAGIACEMDTIMRIANKHQIPVVEDNAHGIFAKYKGKYLGTFGHSSALSFHETKNISCGEGGALILNDTSLIEKAEIIREKGTNRSRFFRGEIDKYSWVDIGSSYLPSDVLAAILYSHLEEADQIQNMRKIIWEKYNRELASWTKTNHVIQPFIPAYCDQSYHIYYLLMPNLEIRQNFIGYLKSNGVHAVFHYLPLHSSTVGQKLGYQPGDFPITEDISDRLIRLPLYNHLTEADQDRIVELILKFST